MSDKKITSSRWGDISAYRKMMGDDLDFAERFGKL